MSSGAAVLLHQLAQAGVQLTVLQGGKLEARPASALTDSHRAGIRAHRAELLAILDSDRGVWDQALAEAWIAIVVARVSGLHDDDAPACPVDSDEWARHETVVSAAYHARSRQGLRDALDAYEAFARETFEAWTGRGAA